MKKYLAEGIGTLFITLVMVLVANNKTGNLAPLAVGATLAGMMYATWQISGAHFNPALTLAMFMRGKIDRTDAFYFILVQIAGAIIASLLGVLFLNCNGESAVAKHLNGNGICSLIAEFLGTFALVYVYLNVTAKPGNEGNSHYGLAVGFTLAGAGWALNGVSGAAFNPALALGATITGTFNFNDFWIYLIGSLLGAAAAASVFQLQVNDESRNLPSRQ